MEETVFSHALEGIKLVKSEGGDLLTKPFLDVCKYLLPVLDKFGPAFAAVKADVGNNILRLECKYSSNTLKFKHLYSLIQPEIEAKTAKSSSSCTNALLWLTRAMDYLVELFVGLKAHPEWSMSQACYSSYNKTLKRYHGWLISSSFAVAMKLAPDRNKFMEVLGGANIASDIDNFCSNFSPLLRENHKFLARIGMDSTKAS